MTSTTGRLGHHTSPLAAALAEDALVRFLRYVSIDTQSQEGTGSYPSTAKQLDLSRLLLDELRHMGAADATLDSHGYVLATVPATAGERLPVVGLIAHVDTSPEASGCGVKPQVIREYDGRVIQLTGDPSQALDPAGSPELRHQIGNDLVTTDGTTLLGADDKAGVAEIMAAAAYLLQHPEIRHGTIRLAFTPDEEIGAGTAHFDLPAFGADVAYTLDGSTAGEIEDESFSASAMTVTLRGHNTHPGYAKGKMINSVKLASRFIESLPAGRLSPETTDGREGYVHPMAIEGGVEQTTVRLIIRDFDDAQLAAHEALVRRLAEQVVADAPGARLTVDVRRSYRNMKRYIEQSPRALQAADEAVRRAGLTPRRTWIRGGTDGARLSELGLPTPNLFTGAHDYHSVREWVSVQDMASAAATVVHLVQIWAEPAEP